jgi:D-serine deaminase-like pyridoxal phosphate-dependent protein
VIEGLPRAAEIAGRPLGVVIECDTGRKRAGVEAAGVKRLRMVDQDLASKS